MEFQPSAVSHRIVRLEAYESKRTSVQRMQQDSGIDLTLRKTNQMMDYWTTLEAQAAGRYRRPATA